MTPTKAGEGKTTTAISPRRGRSASIGEHPLLCLREPSLGPVFGLKGGGTGGGRAQVVPMEQINLHFTGDIHAIGAANNLLAAIDRRPPAARERARARPALDHLAPVPRHGRPRAAAGRDRARRPSNGYPRETGFDITAASEVMAIVAVSRDLADLRARLGAITVGATYDGKPVTAERAGPQGRWPCC